MDIREMLANRGLTDVQLRAKAVGEMENILTGKSPTEVAEIGERILEKQKHELRAERREAERVLKAFEAAKSEPKIPNEVKQAEYIFRTTLESVKDVFGEKVTPEVMVAAVQAGSYGMWRTIMGESKPITKIY